MPSGGEVITDDQGRIGRSADSDRGTRQRYLRSLSITCGDDQESSGLRSGAAAASRRTGGGSARWSRRHRWADCGSRQHIASNRAGHHENEDPQQNQQAESRDRENQLRHRPSFRRQGSSGRASST